MVAMRLLKLVLAALVFAAPAAWAQNTVWKCTGPDGRSQYTNVQRDAQGRNCSVVSKEVSVVPAGKPAATASSSFPSVDRETQRARDDGRRKILEDEMSQEEKQLAEARSRLAEQEAIRWAKPPKTAKSAKFSAADLILTSRDGTA